VKRGCRPWSWLSNPAAWRKIEKEQRENTTRQLQLCTEKTARLTKGETRTTWYGWGFTSKFLRRPVHRRTGARPTAEKMRKDTMSPSDKSGNSRNYAVSKLHPPASQVLLGSICSIQTFQPLRRGFYIHLNTLSTFTFPIASTNANRGDGMIRLIFFQSNNIGMRLKEEGRFSALRAYHPDTGSVLRGPFGGRSRGVTQLKLTLKGC